MARRRHKRKSGYSMAGRIRRAFHGFVKLGIGGLVTAVGGYITNVLSGNLSFTLGNTTIDLGFIPGIIVVGAGIFVMMSALREVLGTKI